MSACCFEETAFGVGLHANQQGNARGRFGPPKPEAPRVVQVKAQVVLMLVASL